MAGTQAVWGIDVGKCAVKTVRLRVAPGSDDEAPKVELLGSDYITHPKILSQPDANREELIASALEKFLSRNDISNDRVVVSVPGQHTLARFSKLPPLDEKKIPDIVRYEADQQIPFDIDEVIWDYQTFREEGSPDVEVGIFAMKRELIREYLLHFENAGIEPGQVQSSPLALANAVMFDGLLAPNTTIILDIGAEITDLIVATDHSLWTRTISLGGNNFTEALVKSFKLSFAKAESLKLSAEDSKYKRQIFQAMRPVFGDLVQEVQRSLGYYMSTHRDAKFGKCLAMGAAFKLPGLQKYLQQNLSMDVERPSSFANIVPSAATNVPHFKDNAGSFAVAYGLAVQGLGVSKIESSLLPPEIARQVVWRKKRPFFAASAACLLMAAGAVWMRGIWDSSALAANKGQEPRVANVDQAATIIDNDLPPITPPREYAKTILAAGDQLQREYRNLAEQGQAELDAIEKITTLVKQKSFMPQIYQVIHEALPKPPEPLANANSASEYMAAIEANPSELKRDQRTEIFIERFDIDYSADAYNVALPEDVSGLPVDEIALLEGMTPEGFLVRLDCRTPYNGQVKYVTDVFMRRLRELGRKPDMGFYINRVKLTRGEPLGGKSQDDKSATPGRRISPRASEVGQGAFAGGRGGGRGGRGGQPVPTQEEPDAKYIDPLTNEPMDDDWAFTIEFDVLLNSTPQTAADDVEQENPEDQQ